MKCAVYSAFSAIVCCPVFALLGCSALGSGVLQSLSTAACPELGPNANALGASYASRSDFNGKIATFVASTKDLIGLAVQAEAEAAEACRRIGRDIGLSDADMAPREEPGGRASGACGPVATRMDAILQSGLRFQANVRPPVCQANANAHANCSGICSAQVNPGEVVARCEPARLSGYCQGRCVGRCEGRCMGECRGQCSQYDAQGRCVGMCNGDCVGGCDSTCHAHCDGQWQAPRCQGYVQPPSADAECNASCRAQADFRASCTPPQVTVSASQNTALAARLAASLQANLPLLLHADLGLARRAIANADVMVQVGQQLPRIIGEAGAHATSCVASSSTMAVRATASLKVTVQASASVSMRAGAGR